jgi:hypothetical protein
MIVLKYYKDVLRFKALTTLFHPMFSRNSAYSRPMPQSYGPVLNLSYFVRIGARNLNETQNGKETAEVFLPRNLM